MSAIQSERWARARTDIHGMILISEDENRLEVWSEH